MEIALRVERDGLGAGLVEQRVGFRGRVVADALRVGPGLPEEPLRFGASGRGQARQLHPLRPQRFAEGTQLGRGPRERVEDLGGRGQHCGGIAARGRGLRVGARGRSRPAAQFVSHPAQLEARLRQLLFEHRDPGVQVGELVGRMLVGRRARRFAAPFAAQYPQERGFGPPGVEGDVGNGRADRRRLVGFGLDERELGRRHLVGLAPVDQRGAVDRGHELVEVRKSEDAQQVRLCLARLAAFAPGAPAARARDISIEAHGTFVQLPDLVHDLGRQTGRARHRVGGLHDRRPRRRENFPPDPLTESPLHHGL